MIYTNVNKDKFSKIALGCADLGTKVDKKQSFNLLSKFLELGGSVVDTGRVYCTWIEGGANASEGTIGDFIKQNNCRDKIVISTKGGHPPIPEFTPSRINDKELTKDITESLKYLKTDYVDIYYLHRDDTSKPVEEIMPTLWRFVKEGKVKHLGASNWSTERIEQANKLSIANGMPVFEFSEIMWSSAKINIEAVPDKTIVVMNDKEYNGYKNSNVKVMAFSSQAQGFFSIAKDNGMDNLPSMFKAKYYNSENIEIAKKIIDISNKTGISPTAVGLTRLIYDKNIDTIPIIGALNEEFLYDSFTALNLKEEYYKELIK